MSRVQEGTVGGHFNRSSNRESQLKGWRTSKSENADDTSTNKNAFNAQERRVSITQHSDDDEEANELYLNSPNKTRRTHFALDITKGTPNAVHFGVDPVQNTDGDGSSYTKRLAMRRQGFPDYTTAATGKFSDIMFKLPGKDTLEEDYGLMDETRPQNKARESKRAPNMFKKPEEKGVKSTMIQDLKNQHASNKHLSGRHHKSKAGITTLNSGPTKNQSIEYDNKRLVNQFLQSLETPEGKDQSYFESLPNIGNAMLSTTLHEQSFPPNSYYSSSYVGYSPNMSLRSLLYHDLEGKSISKVNSKSLSSSYNNSSVESSSYSSSVSLSNQGDHDLGGPSAASLSSTLSSQLLLVAKKREINGLSKDDRVAPESDYQEPYTASALPLSATEQGYYQRHIALQLRKWECVVKSTLKDVILKNETDLYKSIKNFDTLLHDLETIKSQVFQLRKLIGEDYLVVIRRDFDETNPESFESHLKESVNSSVDQLMKLETTMIACQKRLQDQRDTMRKLESLLHIENSLLENKAKTRFAYKYRYVAIDALSLGILLLLIYYIAQTVYWKDRGGLVF